MCHVCHCASACVFVFVIVCISVYDCLTVAVSAASSQIPQLLDPPAPFSYWLIESSPKCNLGREMGGTTHAHFLDGGRTELPSVLDAGRRGHQRL